MTFKRILKIIATFVLLSSCREKNPYLDGERDKSIVIEFQRFEQDFNGFKASPTGTFKAQLGAQYGHFFDLYNRGVIRVGSHEETDYKTYALRFLRDSIYTLVYDSVQHHFPEMKEEEKILTKAFQNYRLLFPERPIPQCYTHISGFNQSIVVDDSVLSVSLENYLGEDHEFYKNLGTYNYLLPHRNRAYLAVDAMRGWIASEFPRPRTANNLLNNMMQEGKYIFIQEVVMSELSPRLFIGLTEEQFRWCENHETDLWRFMVEEQHLFSTHQLTITKYLQNGPFFNFWGSGSSPMPGKYIAWKIVSSYMERNKTVSIDSLLQIADGQILLENSGYRP